MPDFLRASPDNEHSISQYSSYPQRQCRCQTASTYHSPPYAEHTGVPCFIPTAKAQQVMLRNTDIYFRAQPCMAESEAEWIGDDVWGEEDEKAWVRSCLVPDRGESGTRRAVFLIGDSHAGAIAPGLLAALEGAASVVWIAAGFGCGFVSPLFNRRVVAAEDDGFFEDACRYFNDEVDAQLQAQLKPCDVVVIHHREWTPARTMKMQGDADVRASMIERLRGLQRTVNARGAKLVLLGDVPTIPALGKRCAMSSAAEAECEISWSEVQATQHAGEYEVYEMLAQTPGTYYLRLDSLMCAGGLCDAFIPGTSTFAYGDDNHLTTEASIYLWPWLCAFFQDSGLLGTT